MNPATFREYDIRGVAERDFPDDLVVNLGRAYASFIRSEGGGRTIVVGRDCRLTSPRLSAALMRGLVERGTHVIDIGVVPTPVLYFAAHHYKSDGSVMITGSHNPAPDNGFKLLKGVTSVHGESIQHLRELIVRGEYSAPQEQGSVETRDVSEAYLDYCVSQLRLGPRRFKVVVDAGNGAGGPLVVALYKRLNFDVVELFCDMDGTFPNHHPDPTVASNLEDLQRAVVREGAAVGIALDGDADRVGAVDGQGRIIWGDQLMILFGRAILQEQPGATFVGEVKCSQALYDELEKAGGTAIMYRVGHSLIKAHMKKVGAALGGEMSGHIFFANRYLGYDDALYSGARLLEILTNDDSSLAALYDTLPVMVNTPEIRVECADDIKFEVVRRTVERLKKHPDVRSVVDVDGARANFANGWGLVRASNTQPVLVVRCEAKSDDDLVAIRATLEAEIAAVRAEL